jgi:hypothetical protein
MANAASAIIDPGGDIMSESSRVVRRPRRALRHMGRAAVAIIALAGLVLPAAASAGSQSTNTQEALAYSHCMRSHGVPSFPDPSSSGAIPKVSLRELDNPEFRAAARACRRLLPAGTDDTFPPGEVQQLLIGMLRFSQCMRFHGVPNWPDPTTDAEGRPEFPLETVPGTSRAYWRSARITHVGNECQHLLPPALGGIPVG